MKSMFSLCSLHFYVPCHKFVNFHFGRLEWKEKDRAYLISSVQGLFRLFSVGLDF